MSASPSALYVGLPSSGKTTFLALLYRAISAKNAGEFQLGAYGHRGEQGMFEEVNFRLFALAGVDAPYCHWIHFRIIDEKEEAPADQYKGDFWGLYLVIENEDGRFLKNHNLPDGNIFKMAMGTGELNHRGEGQPNDRSDLDKFLGQLPNGWPYGVEIRNKHFLHPDYFTMLKQHRVAHVFNSWADMPPVKEQLALDGSRTSSELCAARFLLKPGRRY